MRKDRHSNPTWSLVVLNACETSTFLASQEVDRSNRVFSVDSPGSGAGRTLLSAVALSKYAVRRKVQIERPRHTGVVDKVW